MICSYRMYLRRLVLMKKLQLSVVNITSVILILTLLAGLSPFFRISAEGAQAPTISITPENGAAGVALETPIVLTFSKAMDQAATQAAFSLTPGTEGNYSWNTESTILSFTPEDIWQYSTVYNIGINTDAVDQEGIHLAAPFSSTFTTLAALLAIEITPQDVSVPRGLKQQFSAVPVWSDGANTPAQVTWSSSVPDNVLIDPQTGLATALAITGSPVEIRASCGDIQGIASMSVTPPVLVDLKIVPPIVSIPEGVDFQFDVLPLYSDGTKELLSPIEWSSSDDSKISVDYSTGLARGQDITNQYVYIRATSGSIQAESRVAVVEREYPYVNLMPNAPFLCAVDGSTFDVTVKAVCEEGHKLYGLAVYLIFDPLYLKVMNAAPVVPLPTVVSEPVIDNEAGTFNYSLGVELDEETGAAAVGGSFDILTITFKAINPTTEPTPIYFSTDQSAQTMAAFCFAFNAIDYRGALYGALCSISEDPAVPAVTFTPADGATSVDLNSFVVLTFNKGMDKMATQNSFSITPEITGEKNWNEQGTVMTFSHSTAFEYKTTYTANLNGALDKYGTALAPTSVSFTTKQKTSSSGGGGGGGSSSAITPSGFKNNTSLATNSSGVIKAATNLATADGKLSLSISKGTKLLSASNTALSNLSVVPAAAPAAAPSNNAILMAYSLGPKGANFSPALTLTLTYDPAGLPAGTAEKDLYIAWFDGSQWQKLETTIDTATHTATARITHLSDFALVGPAAAAPAPAAPSATPNATQPPAATTPATTQPAGTPPSTTVPAATTKPPTTAAPATAAPPASSAPPAATTVPASPLATKSPDTSSGAPWGIIGGIIGAVLVISMVVVFTRRNPGK